MSDIKKIKDEFLLKLKENLDLNEVNQIKTDLFGKTGLISSQFKMLGKVVEKERKKLATHFFSVFILKTSSIQVSTSPRSALQTNDDQTKSKLNVCAIS